MKPTFKKIQPPDAKAPTLPPADPLLTALETLAKRVNVSLDGKDPSTVVDMCEQALARLDLMDQASALLEAARKEVENASRQATVATQETETIRQRSLELQAALDAANRKLTEFRERYHDRYGRTADEDLKHTDPAELDKLRQWIQEKAKGAPAPKRPDPWKVPMDYQFRKAERELKSGTVNVERVYADILKEGD